MSVNKTLVKRSRKLFRKLRPYLVVIVVLFALRSSLADWNDVPTGSMKPSIASFKR